MNSKITAIIGPQGSGKSYLAKELARTKKHCFIDRFDLNYARNFGHLSLKDHNLDMIIYEGANEADFDMLNYLCQSQRLPHLVVTSNSLQREDFHREVEVIELALRS